MEHGFDGLKGLKGFFMDIASR